MTSDQRNTLLQLIGQSVYTRDNDGITAYVDSLIAAERKPLLELLAAANCPNCDGSGSYQDGPDGDETPCQWCAEYAAVKGG